MVDPADFDRAVDALPDWERMPGPQAALSRKIESQVRTMMADHARERAAAKIRYQCRMRRIEFMERSTWWIVLCFAAGVMLAAAIESCRSEPPSTFMDAKP